MFLRVQYAALYMLGAVRFGTHQRKPVICLRRETAINLNR